MDSADNGKKNGRPDAATLNDHEQEKKPLPAPSSTSSLPKLEVSPFTEVIVLSPPLQHAVLSTKPSDHSAPAPATAAPARKPTDVPPHLPPRPLQTITSSPGPSSPSSAPRGSEADLRARLAAESRRLAESQSRSNSVIPTQEFDHPMASPTSSQPLDNHRPVPEPDYDCPGPDAAPQPNPATIARPSTSANVKTVIERVVTAGIALDQLGPLLGLLTSILEDTLAFENRTRNEGEARKLKDDDVDSSHPAAGLPPLTVPSLLSSARLESIDKMDGNFSEILKAVQSLEQQLLVRLPRAPAAKPLVVPPLPTKAAPSSTAVAKPLPPPAAKAPPAEPSFKERTSTGPTDPAPAPAPSSTHNIFSRLGINGAPVSPPPRATPALPAPAPRAASPLAARMDVDPPRNPRAVSPTRSRAPSPPRRVPDVRAPTYPHVPSSSYNHSRPASPPYARPLTPLDPPRPLADRLPPPGRLSNEPYKSPYPILAPYPSRAFQGPPMTDYRQRSRSPPPKRLVGGEGGRYSPPPYVPPRGTFGTPPLLPPQSPYGPPRGYDDRRPGPSMGGYDDRRASGGYDGWASRSNEDGRRDWEGGMKRGRSRSRSRSPGRGPMMMNGGGIGGRR